MNEADLLTQLQPGEALLLSAYPLPSTFDIPVFFEPLDADRIEVASLEHQRIAIVLDGEQPQGRQWITQVREMCHMPTGNTAHFGRSAYYYAFRMWNAKQRAVQYLVYVQGSAEPISRPRIALAMLRQWQAERAPEHNLAVSSRSIFPAVRRCCAYPPKEWRDAAWKQTPMATPERGLRMTRRNEISTALWKRIKP